ncbi:hypothetical protein F8280_12105 [Micromonospora noduli]|uniref:hypothetical protein n=1 Tax=Micromonospora noduli TaxID=709876 RepID=UPI00124B10F3|nr:hypothetical protein [Micromonospora noduli]KAB1925146.1 hypothetical protein F8280_12105 [Micromonospora noduli]
MGVQALSSTTVSLPIGGVWEIAVSVTDADGAHVDTAPTVTVTLPAGSTATPTVETVAGGVYRVLYVVGTAGRYIARVVATDHGAADFAAYATGTTAGTGMPDVTAVVEYIGETSHTEEEIQDALDAESAAQRAVCRVRAVYPDDLRQALLRRVQRNLALRQLPLAVLQGDAGAGDSTVLPGRDPEIRRLEAPHRKLVVG